MRVLLVRSDVVADGGGMCRALAGRVRVVVMRPAAATTTAALALQPLLEMHLGVSLLLIGACELAPAHLARKRLLTRVRPHVCRQVIRPAERTTADTTLERLLACVDANVPRQLIGAREASIAALDGAGVGALVHWRFARPVGVLAGFDRHEP